MNYKITKDDIICCWEGHYISYLQEILNGDYKVEDAREDLMSLIGSKWDIRGQEEPRAGKKENKHYTQE